jgi:integrase
LKDYSYQIGRVHTPQLSQKFWYFVQHLDLPITRPSRSQRKKDTEILKEKHQRPRNYGWYAFRHSLTTALAEAGLSDTIIMNWMGWWSGNPAAPLIHTYTRGAQDIDAKVQAKHPFIKLWSLT